MGIVALHQSLYTIFGTLSTGLIRFYLNQNLYFRALRTLASIDLHKYTANNQPPYPTRHLWPLKHFYIYSQSSSILPLYYLYYHWSNRPFHGSAFFRPCRISYSQEHFYYLYLYTPIYILRSRFTWILVYTRYI